MKCYAISYDLIGPNRNYDKIHKAIRNLGYYAYIHESLFIVKSSKSSGQLYDILIKNLDGNDKLLIIELGEDATWVRLNDEVSNWLKSNL